METIDNTQQEMQQQLQQLREELNSQQIINASLLRNATRQTLHQIRWRTCYVEYILAGFCLLCLPLMVHTYSLPATIIFIIILIYALAITIAMHRMLPNMDDDLVSTAQKLIKFKRTKAHNWKIAPYIAGFTSGIMFMGAGFKFQMQLLGLDYEFVALQS